MARHSIVAFSLVEVNLAILLAAIGLLALFALFPLGLRESEMAVLDTQEAMFADHVLSGMKANAQDITDWQGVWTNKYAFVAWIQEGISPIDGVGAPDAPLYQWDASVNAVKFPNPRSAPADMVRRELRYRIRIPKEHWTRYRKRVVLEIKSGLYGGFRFPQVYSTELVFMGM